MQSNSQPLCVNSEPLSVISACPPPAVWSNAKNLAQNPGMPTMYKKPHCTVERYDKKSHFLARKSGHVLFRAQIEDSRHFQLAMCAVLDEESEAHV